MLAIENIAVLTPLGNAEQTAAGVNAGINVYQESSFNNRKNQPMVMCEVPADAIPPATDEIKALFLQSRRERIIRLASAPLLELFESSEITAPVPVLMVAPEKIPGKRTPIDDRFFKLILELHQDQVDQENSFVFPYGRAGIALALDTARDLLVSGVCSQVVVGGADSFRDLDYLEDLDIEGRILASEVLDGFAPSEAAGFMLLKLADNSKPLQIKAWGKSAEPGHRYSDEPYLGQALSDAAQQILLADNHTRIDRTYANLNGESFFSKEWGILQLRNQKHFSESHVIEHPADCFGDVGAAFGLIMIALAFKQSELESSVANYLVCASSELQPRAVMLLSANVKGAA